MDLRKIGIALAGVAAVVVLALGPAAVAEDKEPSMEEQMAAWAKYASPGQQHEFLAKLAGKWKASAKMWMEPGAPPMETHGISTNEMVLDGRFLQSEFSGEFMQQPFKGMALDGFDNQKQKYIGLWMDTMGTMMMSFEGNTDKDGKVRTMVSEYKDPLTGQMKKMKGVTRIVSANEHVYEGWEAGPQGDFKKVMEITYTRQ